MKIEGKCALVTGGASGFGKGLVKRLLSKDAKFVAILDSDAVAGTAVASEFGEEFGTDRVRFIPCDVSVEEMLEAGFEAAFLAHGRLDIVVNNAGVWDSPKILQINLGAVIRGTYLAKKYMNKDDGKYGGVVINTSSVLGFLAIKQPEYTATKHGVLGFSLSMAKSDPAFTSGENLRIVSICPSVTETQFYRDHLNALELVKATSHMLHVDQVVDAFVLAIEDETKNGCCIRITPGTGIDLLPVKSAAEWEEELKIRKK